MRILRRTQKEIKNEITLHPSFAETYVSLREELKNNIFLLDNGDLAVTYQIPLIYDDPLEELDVMGQAKVTLNFMKRAVLGFPFDALSGNAVVQLICRQRTLLSLEENEQEIHEKLAKKLIKNEETLYIHNGLVKRDLFLSVRFVNMKKFRFFEGPLEVRYNKFHTGLKNISLETGFSEKRLGASEVLKIYHNFLGGAQDLSFDPYQVVSLEPLHQKIYLKDAAQITQDTLSIGSNTLSCYHLLNFPKSFAFGDFKHVLNGMAWKDWDVVFTLSEGRTTPTSAEYLTRTFYNAPHNMHIYERLADYHERMSSQNPAVKASLKMILHNIDEEREVFFKSQMRMCFNDMPVFREKDIHTPFIAGCLPMNTFQKLNAVHTRFKTMLFDDAALFFPLFGGVPPQKGARHWVSAQSTPTSFDLMGRGGNQTTIVLGASGGGKSCFMAQQIIEFLGRFPEGIVRIIDKRTSSEKIVDLFGGQLVKFTDASLRERPFSPFAIPTWTEDDIKTCVNGLLYAMTMLSPEASINSGHIEVLTDAVKNCGNKQIQEMKKSEHYHFTWSHVKQCLEDGARKLNIDVRYAHDLMNWGISFERHKSMGYIFDTQQKTIDKSLPKMVVFDLQGVQDAQTQNISAQIAFSKIISDIQRIPAKVPKLIIIEELGVVLSGDTPQTEEMANKQISNIVKTIRKLGGVPFGITNELDDFFSKKGGRSFWMQSTQKVFLPFTSQMNTSLLNHTQTFSEPDRELIASLHLNKKEKYSMAYIKQDEGFVGSIKIPLSPLMNAVITTDANEVSCYQDLRKNGMGVKETIEYMAEHHPYGAGL